MLDTEKLSKRESFLKTKYYVRTKFPSSYLDLIGVSGVEIDVIFAARPIPNREINSCYLHGDLFQCNDFCSFATNIRPESFIIEEWTQKKDPYHWELTEKMYFNGVEWSVPEHSTGGLDSACWGWVEISYASVFCKPCSGVIQEIPRENDYPEQELIRLLGREYSRV